MKRERARGALGSSPDLALVPFCVAVADATGRLTYANAAWMAALSTAESAAADTGSWLDDLDPRDRAAARDRFAAALLRGEDFVGEWRVGAVGRPARWFRFLGRPIDAGDRAAVLVAATDVTAYKTAERLREIDELKTAFLRNVSHDLRNPMTVVRGLASTLEADADRLTAEQRADLLGRLRANAERLDAMVSGLLDLEQLARDTIAPMRRPTDLGALVQHLVETLEPRGHPVGVEAEPIVADVDPLLVERMIENLVANAVRHTALGTPIWVRVVARRAGVLVMVDDAGPGVGDELKEAVFEPFRRGGGCGTGIGLSLVGCLAAAHGGRAWVEDRAGGGASFRVLLPRGRSEPRRAPGGSRAS